MSYEMQKKNRDEEKVFSVTMTKEELSLFSEFLEQREYAVKDYFFAVENKAGVTKTANSPGVLYDQKSKKVYDYRPMDAKTISELKASRSHQARVLQGERKRFQNLNLSDKDQLAFRNEKYSSLLTESRNRSIEQGESAASAAKRRAGYSIDSKSRWMGNASKDKLGKLNFDIKRKGTTVGRMAGKIRMI